MLRACETRGLQVLATFLFCALVVGSVAGGTSVPMRVNCKETVGRISRFHYGVLPHLPLDDGALYSLAANNVPLTILETTDLRERSLLLSWAGARQSSQTVALLLTERGAARMRSGDQLMTAFRTVFDSESLAPRWIAVPADQAARLKDGASSSKIIAWADDAIPLLLPSLRRTVLAGSRGDTVSVLGQVLKTLTILPSNNRVMAQAMECHPADWNALLRSVGLLWGWGRMEGNRLALDCPAPLVAVATRSGKGVQIAVANPSERNASARLFMTNIPRGWYDIERRRAWGRTRLSAPESLSSLFAASDSASWQQNLDLAPASAVVIRLEQPLETLLWRLNGLIQSLETAQRLSASARQSTLAVLRQVKKDLEQERDARRMSRIRMPISLHRSVARTAQAEAVFKNALMRAGDLDRQSVAICERFEQIAEALSEASARSLGLGLSVEKEPSPRRKSANVTIVARLQNTGAHTVSRLSFAVEAPEGWRATPLSPMSFPSLPPSRSLTVRILLDCSNAETNRTTLDLTVSATYSAYRTRARYTRHCSVSLSEEG